MQFGNDLSNRTLLKWWNSFVEKNKKENLERLFAWNAAPRIDWSYLIAWGRTHGVL